MRLKAISRGDLEAAEKYESTDDEPEKADQGEEDLTKE